ncbi:DUF2987 domain-containing protein [Alteromonas sp. 5E99-2]|uniref:DUF2987 domain-containing protein n=1 Tax=Alteromonas sp. 5E99-2 TaxID=2817683 RepID=UPI001A9A15D5|nr:DUF2987 domain-containing protein [Alteromonas sp. 5E99-2]MBO1255058.1 DUF2987 domain-containing protein [Alteromonas sp. 5E99-2]
MKSLLVLILSLSFVLEAWGNTIETKYYDFHRHIQNLRHPDTSKLTYSFGFIHVDTQTLCQINEATLALKDQTIDLIVDTEYRFKMPSTDDSELANGKVVLDVIESPDACEMSVRLETKEEYLKVKYSKEDLNDIKRQYVAFFNEMGSFMSFGVPSVNGLMITFDNKYLYHDFKGIGKIQNGFMIIENQMLSDIDTIIFPEVPARITALTSR